MNIIKRNGSEVAFDKQKIFDAIKGANKDAPYHERLSDEAVMTVTDRVTTQCHNLGHTPSVEEIQTLVENALMDSGSHSVAREYITYRYEHDAGRDTTELEQRVLALVNGTNEDDKQENSNKNPDILSVQRDYLAGEVSKAITWKRLVPPDIVKAHKEGIIHFHDGDYFIQHSHNCCLINLADMLQNGTVISGTMIEKPHSFATACNIATQIIAQVASNQYGGQTVTLSHLAPFVDISRQKIRDNVIEEMANASIPITEEQRESIVADRLKKEIKAGIQTIQYQVETIMTTNGQAPFITVFMYLDEVPEGQIRDDLAMIIEETIRQRYRGVKNEAGVWATPAFPKLVYVLDEDNIYPDSKYYYITQLAAKCTAKRMVPDYVSAKIMRQLKLSADEEPGQGDVYGPMGCRSFLTPDRSGNGFDNIANAGNWEPDTPKYYGRFNQGVVTLNLPDIALSSDGDFDKFWEIFDERLALCHSALRVRHERLLNTPSDVAPILWQHGALARLEKGETINELLYHGYSTLSLGYAGLYECVKYMTGASHTDEEAKPFAIEVMKHMNNACTKWKAEEDIDYSVYGTPIESTTYKFAKCLQRRFGVIPDITDHGYITNSYHVNVREDIDAYSKLAFEAEFQPLSPGGAISYIEVPDMQDNLQAVIDVMTFIYDHIMYAELNTKSDYCQVCGYDGEIQIYSDEHGKLGWKCPNCGNTDQNKMSVARRTCGYIGTQFWNQGRTQEIKDRVLHL